MRVGKYELGRTLGEGSFAKVKLARNLESGLPFAVKIIDKHKIIRLNLTDSVLASKSKIYMVLEYVSGGELYERIASKGRGVSEADARKIFHQLIDGVSYCHSNGVFHRDLKPENVLMDAKGCIKISDFGLSALPRHLGKDGLLHTLCGSPNYVAPEVLLNKGYDGATCDIWSCGVILYVILTGFLPFDDRNITALYYKIVKGDVEIPKEMSSGAGNMIRRILDPNPATRITMSGIKAHEWFIQDYYPTKYTNQHDRDDHVVGEIMEDVEEEEEEDGLLYKYSHGRGVLDDAASTSGTSTSSNGVRMVNAFQLIGMSSFLDLSGFFEDEASERRMSFAASSYSLKDLVKKMVEIVTDMGFRVHKRNRIRLMMIKVVQQQRISTPSNSNLSVAAEVLPISPSLHVVELRKSYGDSDVYRQLCKKLSKDLGVQLPQS
ncbi:CBL-interacting serine/threonine-protein kinase 1 [Linum perenne]